MKNLLTTLLVCLAALTAQAQKMVIGSKVPDLRGTQWHTQAPASQKPMLIEFYNPENSSSARFFPKLAEIHSRYGDRIAIVVITRQNGPEIEKIIREHGKFCIGRDADGKIYQNFNVQFLPYTILVNSKGELHWQGNLGNITDRDLDGL